MPENTKEEEKYLEKLNEMQKFLPFLDYMIDKIQKKNNEIPLKCQLGKFQVLRSVITEKDKNCSLDNLVKAEDVIEKLIARLGLKEQLENSKEFLPRVDNQNFKTSMATSISIVPSSTTTVSVTSSSSSKTTTVDFKPQEFSNSTVDLIMKTLKISVDGSLNKSTDRGPELLSNSLGANQPVDICGKTMETDLDKDLDGFDLTDCPNFSETESSSSAVETVSAVPEKASLQNDLLSSSREKLLKSLQSRLLPCRTDRTLPQSSAVNKAEKPSESQSISAFSRDQSYPSERKSNSDVSDISEAHAADKSNKKLVDISSKCLGKPTPVSSKSPKSIFLSEKGRSEPSNTSESVNLKQRLKEKFSTDICEVYRVPGKSVGGSLRSLKDSKNQKSTEEPELFKTDKIEKNAPKMLGVSSSRSSSEKKDNATDKTHRNEKKDEKNEKQISHKRDKGEKSNDTKDSKSSKSKSHTNESSKSHKTQEKKQESKSSKDCKKPSTSTTNEEKSFGLDKMNDDELLDFVKENMQSLPHLAKLKPAELRKAVQSSLMGNVSMVDADNVSEISDDSFHDSDEFTSSTSKVQSVSKKNVESQESSRDKNESKERHPLASVKIAQLGPDGVAKNVKPIVEPSKETKFLDEIGDKTHDIDESLDEEDYAQKLIDETTPKILQPKRKKGLLELPMPIMDDLFDDISSIESFETSDTSNDTRDPRLAKATHSAPSENKNKQNTNKPEFLPQLNVNPIRPTKETWPASCVRTNLQLPIDAIQGPRLLGCVGPVNPSMESHRMQRGILERPDMWSSKPIPSHIPPDMNQYPQICNRYPNDSNDPPFRNICPYPAPPINCPRVNDPRRNLYCTSEPKSYAEYKRMKLKEQEKLNQMETTPKENPKNTFPESSNPPDTSRLPVEREDTDKAGGKSSEPKNPRFKDSVVKQNISKNYYSSRAYDDRRKHSAQRRFSDHTESRDFRERKVHHEESKKDEADKTKKVGDEKRHSLDCDELVSPLEELYRNENKPQTGRGYGIQHFKIPKKVREPPNNGSKPVDKQAPADPRVASKEDPKILNTQTEIQPIKQETVGVQSNVIESEVKAIGQENTSEVAQHSKIEELGKADTSVGGEKVDFDKVTKVESANETAPISCETVDSSETHTEINTTGDKNDSKVHATESGILESKTNDTNESQTVSDTVKPDVVGCSQPAELNQSDVKETAVIKNVSRVAAESVKKCEAQVVECDSSMESSLAEQKIKKDSEKPSDKSTVVSKEEITQEFVEALIRKSFQSGEGKLLLAQAKLFEEFARKLNSKKLKTIQKIINSESDSSSSSSEADSEDEKKKKKSKKSEEKSQKKKRKKKGKKSRRPKSSSSSSSSSLSSESEESGEDENFDKREGKHRNKKKETSVEEENKVLENQTAEETKSKSSESSVVVGKAQKSKKKRKNSEFGRYFSGRKSKRKQQQKKLLEQMLSESPQSEVSQDSNAVAPEAPAKESEPKRKPKGKVKTELDRLHEDIRSMFISEGVVTATGQRMCRILKQSGGNMNNLDIVKESAKMVEEEKLKIVETRPRRRKTRNFAFENSEGRSRSLSSDKIREIQQEYDTDQDPKLKREPRVVLQRVDLDNFGYGVKISDDCISFRRMEGRNTAIRGSGSSRKFLERSLKARRLVGRIYLRRNLRKCEMLKKSKSKKKYFGKKLMDIVKNLPLKLAKMKHLKICDKKTEEVVTNKKLVNEKAQEGTSGKIIQTKVDLSNAELLTYAFERKRATYSCKLCTHVTKNITGHYKAVHPEHEVLISRLAVAEAKRAKMEAKKKGYNAKFPKQTLAESINQKMKTLLNQPTTYICRMCTVVKTTELNAFAAHVASHTGEFRFSCPAEGCPLQTYYHEDMKFHILMKHTKNKVELSNKIAELYTIPNEEGNMFGYLCSECNFVQICRSNVESHISRQHPTSKTVKVIKINMSWNLSKVDKNKPKGETLGDSENTEPIEEEKEKSKSESVKEAPEERKCRKRKRKLPESSSTVESHTHESLESRIKSPEMKKIFLGTSPEPEELKEKTSENSSRKENVPGEESERLEKKIDTEDCMDLKTISSLKGSDIIESVESPEKKETAGTVGKCDRLSVGPLAAQLSENSEVLYECSVQGCLFFTRVFDLFEKHIKITHWKTKWSGVCEICYRKKAVHPRGENLFKLLTALRHLELHVWERNNDGKLSKEDLIMELKLINSSEESAEGGEEPDTNEAKKPSEIEEEAPAQKKTESTETPYPAKPLLRVRNLLGDRLSTPKESPEENDLVAINEDPSFKETPANSSSMFTIEDVRSLTDVPTEKSEIQIEQVCSLKDQPPKLAVQSPLGPNKAIVVRSCPTRKIAIRPEPNAFSFDVGQLNVVQAPTANQPVVLNPLSNNSPIRIISSPLSPKCKFSVKPIMVSTDAGRAAAPNVVSVIRPALSPTQTNASPSAEVKSIPHKSPLPENSPAAQSKSPDATAGRCKSPVPHSVVHHIPKNSPEAEDIDEKDTITLQRIHSSPNVGNKSVKDAKIYEEMLTKTKLCHLFKCMGIECSFTCNNECVFRQHIGLHEAQRRLKKNKGMRTIYIRLANKTTRAFYWQQCAYCCEVLSNTNNALSQHILEEHGHCMYQCAFCFYRAVSHSYVEIHQNLAHGQILKTSPRVIYKCKPLRIAPSQAAALEKHGRRQSVRPYHCDQCGRKFFITQEFMNHLTTEHQSVTAYTCHICKNLCFKADRLIVHYKLHSYCTYQCAYCLHGTETEKEMVFHLCNFHFSQPAVMYVRAFAEGQKQLSNQLDSLKVIVYESDTVNADCIVEADPEDEIPENISEANSDLSAIVAELGINTDIQSSPLIKELASIGDKSTKNLTVKTLLPNAQFSSENESGSENCSVLISSGLSTPSGQNDEKEMSIPLGQLPLDVVNVQHKEAASSPSLPKNIGSPDKNLKLNEIIVNLQQKDRGMALPSSEEEKTGHPPTVILSSAVHKLPPVVLTRSSVSKNVYPSKSLVLKKKAEEPAQGHENVENDVQKRMSNEKKEDAGSAIEKSQETTLGGNSLEAAGVLLRRPSTKDAASDTKLDDRPLITSVVSLSGTDFEKEAPAAENSLVISEVCSLSGTTDQNNSNASGIVINIQSKVNSPTVLKPPIIRVEDFPIGEDLEKTTPSEGSISDPAVKDANKTDVKEQEYTDAIRSFSPDIIILEQEKAKDIDVVTLDSDDEKEESQKKGDEKSTDGKTPTEVSNPPVVNETIRKEMELLRNQIASETDSLLFDEPEGEKPKRDLTLNIDVAKPSQDSDSQNLLSPIEEAICSLNKKLQSETEEAQKKDDKEEKGEKDKKDVSDNAKPVPVVSEEPARPRTRFSARDRRKEAGEGSEKTEGEDSRKDEAGKCKKFQDELVGKDLFICGNEKCNFAAEDDSSLKDHLYVCDLSRESIVLTCPHCSRQIKQFHPYLEHLKYHGEKKFHCGLCSFSSAVDGSVSRHVKQKHKCSLIKVMPKDGKPGHVLYYPKNYKVDKVDFEVNGYSPGDEDKLPLQSVYQVNVKCAKCPYFTKVRSNMVRHLKIHVKSVETEGVVVVPSTAPTNPVPCLETKERMFDKMTNLAASSQLAQAKEKVAIETLSPEEEAKLPQFVAEQMRYKCCLPDCNYITVDEGMLKHHIKALHDEINYYSCPHCKNTVHADVRHVILDKIGHHLKHHDSKLYKCAHCIYFHYQKNVVEKHTIEKHPDRRYFVHTVREPKPEVASEEEQSCSEGGARMWRCGLCEEFRNLSKSALMDHLLKSHNTKSKYGCKLCPMKGNSYQAFFSHFASKHPGEKVSYIKVYLSEKVSGSGIESQSGNSSGADSSSEHFDTTPLWQRGTPRIRHIRGILIEEEEIKTKKSKKAAVVEESEADTSDSAVVKENAFYCPLCTNKKKPFYTRSESCFRTHLYQELNYQQFACILCGKMFVDKKDFDKHHSRVHPDKSPALKQTKEDHEIKFWVDQVIAKRLKQMEDKKRKLSETEASGSQVPPKKKKEV